MAFPTGWDGYDTITLPNPASGLTDYTYLLSLSSLSASWKAAADGSGGGIRVTDMSDNLLPMDMIYPHTGTTTGLIAFKFSPANTGTQQVKIWNDQSGESQPSASDTYGRHNAYASHVRAFYPDGGGNDRTSYANNLTMTGSPTVGGTSGPINGSLGTNYNGSTQYGRSTVSVPTAVPLTLHAHGKSDSATVAQAAIMLSDTDVVNNSFAVQWRGDVASDPIYARIFAAGTGSLASRVGYTTAAFAHGAAVFATNTSRTAYADGTGGTSDTASLTPSSVDSIAVGAAWNNAASTYFDGILSMVTVHTAALSSDWISYWKEMLDDADQSDFYTFGSWTENAPPDTTPPEVVGITVNSTGDEITVEYDEAVSGDEDLGWSLTSDGDALSISSASGSGTDTHTWIPDRVIYQGETITADYEDGTGDLEDAAGNDLADVASFAVTNDSDEVDPGGGGSYPISNAPIHANVKACWEFNDNPDDVSGNENHATLANGAAYTTSSKIGSHALAITATDDQALLGTWSGLGLSDASAFTIGGWLYRTSNTDYGTYLFSCWGAGVNDRCEIQNSGSGVGGSDDIIWSLGKATVYNAVSLWTTSNWLTQNAWNHIACVYDGSLTGDSNRMKAYGNGVLLGSSFSGSSVGSTAPTMTSVGAYAGRRAATSANNETCRIDQLFIASRAYTAAEIARIARGIPYANWQGKLLGQRRRARI